MMLLQEERTRFSLRRRQRNIQCPLLPTHLFLSLRKPGLPPLLLEELNGHRTPDSSTPRPHIRVGVKLLDKRRGPLLNQGF